MKNINIFLMSLFLTLSAKAATLECKSVLNLLEVTNSNVITALNNRVLVDKIDELAVYVTEKKSNMFSLEVFIANLEMRIYSEAALNNVEDVIKAQAWSRDMMLDVVCKKLK